MTQGEKERLGNLNGYPSALTSSLNAQSESGVPSHTPGPWEVAKGSEGMLAILVEQEGRARFICDVRGRFIRYTTDGPVTDDRTVEASANARLIAAAPDLLAALKGFGRAWESVGQCFCGVSIGHPIMQRHSAACVAARAAIAKAEGQQ